MAIFELAYFRNKPRPFFTLAKELYPGTFKPSAAHYFVRLLHEHGLLLRHYTQNIDTLERIAGIPDEKLVEAHGTFYTNHCLKCGCEYSMEWVKEKIFADVIPKCECCRTVVKPDIVFFGENLPEKFYQLPPIDFEQADLLIVMGTSLEVQPFASLLNAVNKTCVRLLINREEVGATRSGRHTDGFHFGRDTNRRDVAWLGDCDDGVWYLATELGLRDELATLIEREHKQFDKMRNGGVSDDETDDDGCACFDEKVNSARTVSDEEVVISNEACALGICDRKSSQQKRPQ